MPVHAPRSDEEVVILPSHVVSCRYYHSHFHHHFLSGTLLPPILPEFDFLTRLVTCGLTLLLFCSVLKGFSPGTLVFTSHKRLTFDLIQYVVIQFDL